MTFPAPVAGMVIRYAYLWRREYERGRAEAAKDRPCAILLAVMDDAGDRMVVVLPVTHSPPSDPAHAVEIPAATKQRLGLDDARSWIILTEANRFIWPGPDLRPIAPGSVVYGELPAALFRQVRANWLALAATRRGIVPRSE